MRLAVDQPFDLAASLECGQGHRWCKSNDSGGWYEAVLGTDLVRIRQVGGANCEVEFDCAEDEQRIAHSLHRHFRLDDDVEAIYADLCKRDRKMALLVKRYPGMRVMRIDPWECLVFFILSANTNIPRIQQCMERISQALGSPVSLNSRGRFTFPTPNDICEDVSGLEKLKGLRLGLDKETKIYQAAIAVHSGGMNLGDLAAEASSEKVNKTLGQLYGVGDKVANCVALFSLEKLDAFPVDTHIGHNLQKLYWEEPGYPRSRTQRTTGLRKWAQQRFGRYAGYAETFLFIDDLRENN